MIHDGSPHPPVSGFCLIMIGEEAGNVAQASVVREALDREKQSAV
jgi:hypothetical protein